MCNYKKKFQKSRYENRKGFTRSKLRTLFTGGKIFHYFSSESSASEASAKQTTKTSLALGLGKSIFVCKTFRMDAQLHIQANQEI